MKIFVQHWMEQKIEQLIGTQTLVYILKIFPVKYPNVFRDLGTYSTLIKKNYTTMNLFGNLCFDLSIWHFKFVMSLPCASIWSTVTTFVGNLRLLNNREHHCQSCGTKKAETILYNWAQGKVRALSEFLVKKISGQNGFEAFFACCNFYSSSIP